jgi:hypothetical protein
VLRQEQGRADLRCCSCAVKEEPALTCIGPQANSNAAVPQLAVSIAPNAFKLTALQQLLWHDVHEWRVGAYMTGRCITQHGAS